MTKYQGVILINECEAQDMSKMQKRETRQRRFSAVLLGSQRFFVAKLFLQLNLGNKD